MIWEKPLNVLLTGGAGYIGSHTAVECLAAGHEVVVFDNLSNSSVMSLDRVTQIAGKAVTFVQGDIRDRAALRKLFADHRYRRGGAFCRAEGGGRVGGKADPVLRQQYRAAALRCSR